MKQEVAAGNMSLKRIGRCSSLFSREICSVSMVNKNGHDLGVASYLCCFKGKLAQDVLAPIKQNHFDVHKCVVFSCGKKSILLP